MLDNSKKNILVVDDDVSQLEMMGEILSPYYEVSSARSGKQAIEYIRAGNIPDLILLDVLMPGMDGYQTFEELMKLEKGRLTPVVFLTAVSEADAELKGLEMGAADYITKPFINALFLARIKNHLRTGARLRNARERIERSTSRRPGKPRGAGAPSKFVEKKEALHGKPLSRWEKRIAHYAQEWLTTKEIAARMGTTPGTIAAAIDTIYAKLNIHSKRELEDIYIPSEE